nr:hypothetical protein [Tanacetum cinerariifolium]
MEVDKTWDHVTQHIEGNGKKAFICNFCHKIILGGGINRVKKHLTGQKGEVAPCTKVDPDVRYTMEGLLKENDHKLKQKGIEFAESNVISDDDEEQQVREASQPKTGKRKATTNTHPFFTKVQMVIDNGANYKAVGILLSERYRTVTWSPCAAHCLNLVLKDVSELDNVKEIITFASRVTVFIYNHKWPLNWLRKRHGWTEIIRPVATRFGIAFITLKSLVDHKNDLQAMVISSDFKKMLRVKNALDCKQIIMNENFWNNCLITFDRENLCKKREVFQGVLDMAEKHYSGDELTDLNKAIGMLHLDKRSYDPVDYECIDETDFWMVEEVAQGELDYDQLENMLEQEPPSQTQGLVDEDDDDSEFHLLSDRELDAYNTPMSQ